MAKKHPEFKFKHHIIFQEEGEIIVDLDDMSEEQQKWIMQAIHIRATESLGYTWDATPEERKAFFDSKPDYSDVLEASLPKQHMYDLYYPNRTLKRSNS